MEVKTRGHYVLHGITKPETCSCSTDHRRKESGDKPDAVPQVTPALVPQLKVCLQSIHTEEIMLFFER